MRTISQRSIRQRTIVLPIIVTFIASAFAILLGEGGAVALVGGALLLFWNAFHVARRQAYTEAVRHMAPLDRVDDPTVFPDDIDPDLAMSSAGDIMPLFAVQMLVATVAIVPAWVLALMLLKILSLVS